VFSQFKVTPFRYFLSTLLRPNFLALSDHTTSDVSKVSSQSYEYLATKICEFAWKLTVFSQFKVSPFQYLLSTLLRHEFLAFSDQIIRDVSKFRLDLMSI
jgi:hypothetical protein